MHDLAGCRLIFDRVEDLADFREKFHQSRARHRRLHPEKYDYIATPKETGYRGIHDVFSYHVDDSSNGSAYNGLRIEIQYRTKAQYAWATATYSASGSLSWLERVMNFERAWLHFQASGS